jgi:hypothetical protein
MRTTLSLVATLGVVSAANAQSIILDGAADKAYGAPVIVQNTQTQFGDSNLGVVDFANGSEIDAAYAKIDGGFLFLLVAGNLESNFNKLEVFIDAVKGGQNRLRGNNLDVDFNGLNRMGDDGSGNGLTFDKGFAADFWVGITCGASPLAAFMNRATLPTKGNGEGGYLGTGGAGLTGAVVDFVDQNPSGAGFGYGLDNSNIAGVGGGTDIASGSGVTTGVEFKIPLSAIPGYSGGDLKICVFINGQGHDFLSNQVLGPIGGGGNQNLQGSNGTIIGINNSNTAGVTTRSGDGFGVSTGVEIAIPLNLLVGYDGESDVKVTAFVNGGGHDFLSNQVAAPIGGGGNLGEPRNVNFANIPGDQFFVVSPTSAPACPGDYDNSGAIDASDIATLLGAWGTAAGDITGDGVTDAGDLATLLGAWGDCV